ncbi:hypothetical protein [Oerskovia flava]|uniref:hypothetical protein n=1 Tax=Oerskovia flava TaxID=2986422 RepID=UPI00223F5A14|nr:hypothetical protein [Oerskovia sp. JB1-3-2]
MTDRTTKGSTGRDRARRPLGLRLTEGFLPIFGPAQVGRQGSPGRGVSPEEQSRERELRTRFEYVTGPDGRSYVVEHTSAAADAPDEPTPHEPTTDEPGEAHSPG